VETYQRKGPASAYNIKLPAILGKDGAGVVEEVGPNSKWKKGDRVYIAIAFGGYAQFAVANDNEIFRLPEHVSFEQGAAIGVPYRTAYNALFHIAKSDPSDLVLIHGCSGGAGVACLEFCKQRGIRVIGTAGTEEGLKLIKERGCEEVFNHREEGYVEKISKHTGGKGVNVIIEMLANVNLVHDMNLVAIGGRIVIVGCRGEITINPRLLMGKRSSVHGMILGQATEKEKEEMEHAIFGGLTNKTLNPLINKIYPLKDISKVHHDIINSTAYGKLIVLPWQN